MKLCCKLFILLVLVATLIGCKKAEEPRRSAEYPVSAPASLLEDKSVHTKPQASEKGKQELMIDSNKRKIIKEGEIIFETSDLNKTKELINKAVNELQAYVAEENQDKYNDRIENKTIIRVPSEKFDRLVEIISASAEIIERKNIKAIDVTEEYIDIEARLKTRKELENRYHQLLGQAKKVDEVLNIERQLGEIREQIEAAEGKLKYLNDRITFSTLTIVYYQKVASPIGFSSKFIEGMKNGWKNFAMFFVILANIWPFIVFPIIVIYSIRKLRKKMVMKKEARKNE